MIRFAAPLFLAFGVPLALLVLFRLRKLPREHVGGRRRAIQLCLALSAICATLALAGMELGARIDRIAVIYTLDRSRSVERAGSSSTSAALEQIRNSIEGMRVDDRAGLVVFGAEAATEVIPAQRPAIGVAQASIPRDATDIGQAIRRALADLPAEYGGRIVLVSDGVETQGDALAAAAVAAGRDVSIDVLPLERAPAPEVAVERVRVPSSADPGEPIEVRIVTRSTHRTRANVTVMRDGTPIARTETELAAGDDVLVMNDVAPEDGIHRYQVVVDPIGAGHDASRENNEGGGFVRITTGSRAIVLAAEPSHEQALADAMRRAGLEVEVRSAPEAPADLAELASYDLLVLADVPARSFTEGQLRMISQYVRDLGGGLLMVGTRGSFGLGGYAYTPVEEALPATFDLRNRRDRASLAMLIAIDNSGSMGATVGGRTKLEIANEAAARSAMLLSPFDRVGVIHVDTGTTWTQPMVSVENPDSIAARVRTGPQGGGGIDVDVACRDGYGALRSEETQLKHMLLFADGDDSQNLSVARPMTVAAARDGITTTIVSMGHGTYTPELERMSRTGNGRFYIVENMSELPSIFTQETIEASRSAVVEEPFQAATRSAGAATRNVDVSTAPALGGYVVVNARPRASVLLEAKDGDPLLAVWQHGIGKSAVFTTDAGSSFGAPWLTWSGYSAIFGQLARDLARAPERADARVSVTLDGGVGRIRVEAVDEEGRYENYLDLSAGVAVPTGEPHPVTLTQTGAGRYEATFPANAPGPYLVTVRDAQRGIVGTAGFVRPAGDELRGEGTNRTLLARIAAITGGAVRSDLSQVFRDRPPLTYAYEPLHPYLIALSIVLLLVSVALRRLVIDRQTLLRLVPSRFRTKHEATRDLPIAEDTLDALTARKAANKERVAEEIEKARAEQPAVKAPPRKAAKPSADAPATEPPPADPASLAETLLARKKKK